MERGAPVESSDWTTDAWWAGTRAPLTQATGLDPAAYTDDRFFAVEQERVFERAWVCVGLAADITEPGRLLVRSLGSRSIVITRSADDGIVRGFLNSCRHRGTELAAADCDIGSTIRCPYHRWGYATDGRLIATPRFEDVPREGFDRADHGLVAVRVETWGGLLFACLDPATVPLDVWLGDLPARMAGYGLDQWVPVESRRIEIAANWKLISENFQEYYHLTWVHPELAKVSRVADHYRYQGPGMYCGQTTTPVSADDRDDWLRMPPAPGPRRVRSVQRAVRGDLPQRAAVGAPEPRVRDAARPVLGPGATSESCTWLVPPTTGELTAEDIGPTRTFWLDINGEDIDIVERGQRGLARGAVPAGPAGAAVRGAAPSVPQHARRPSDLGFDGRRADPGR